MNECKPLMFGRLRTSMISAFARTEERAAALRRRVFDLEAGAYTRPLFGST